MEIPSPPPPGDNLFQAKTKITPTMAIILVCLMSFFFVMCCVSIYARHLVERRLAAAASFTTLESHGVGSGRRSRRRAPARGLDPSLIDSFPTFLYSEVRALKIDDMSLECAVCLNEFEDLENLRFLPRCCHVFHSDCIGAWLSSHVTCPVCRSNLIPKPGESIEISSPNPFNSGRNHDPEPESIVQIESPEIVSTVEILDRNCERFTLRLPEEVRSRLVTTGLSRTKSCVAFPRARSERKGFRTRSGGAGYERFDRSERPDRWWFVATPPVFSRGGSGRTPRVGGDGEEVTATPKSLLTAVTAPLHQLIRRGESEKRYGEDGERSSDRLRSESQT
ncbi:RING-H2 finger protein ATL11-like [Actinidia eriantha]|uniref:RING-H2 finger protein ATL11-like n=1 Tax=Actinidia eriantha TaxID=165200 RepID=UPI00258B0ECC|nr:RING-H2 finger protein ATL11-like [Actinidia eriantha]